MHHPAATTDATFRANHRIEVQALRFMWALQRRQARNVRNRRSQIAIDTKEHLPTQIYEPTRGFQNLPCILLVHGLSPLAELDPRIIRLAISLAKVGYRVYTPRFPEIQALTITERSIDRIERSISAVAGQTMSGRIGLFSASLSGGLSLIAASRPRVSQTISAACVVGGFACVNATIRYLMLADEADPYGRLIILKNFLPRILNECSSLLDALEVAIEDNFYARTEPRFPALLRQLSPPQQSLLHELLNNPHSRRHYADQILAGSLQTLAQRFDVIANIAGLRAPVFLLHGQHDRVIPASQCQQLSQALDRSRIPHRAAITPLLGHGETHLHAFTIRHLAQVMRVIGCFFECSKHA